MSAEYGLYTSIFPALFYMIFGTSRHCSVGRPRILQEILGAFAVVALMAGNAVKKITGEYNDSEANGNSTALENIEVSTTVGLMVGIVQVP